MTINLHLKKSEKTKRGHYPAAAHSESIIDVQLARLCSCRGRSSSIKIIDPGKNAGITQVCIISVYNTVVFYTPEHVVPGSGALSFID
jgi:hypothetical protein